MPLSPLPRLLIAFVIFVAGIGMVTRVSVGALARQGNRAPAALFGWAPPAVDEPALLQAAIVRPVPLPPVTAAALRATIDQEPLSAAPYFLLGASTAATGDLAKGERLADAALDHNPRLVPALIWKAQRAVEAGRFDAAGTYTIRLAGLRPAEQAVADILAALSYYPQVRPQVLAALARNPDWRSGYLGALSRNGAANGLVYKALGIGNPVKINLASERGAFLGNLVTRQDYEKAYTAWVSWLPDQALGAVGYIYDGDFTGAPGERPFNWEVLQPENATVGLGQGAGLTLNFDVSHDALFLNQLLVVPPGRYRLLTKIGPIDRQTEGADPALSWQLTCLPGGTSLAETVIGTGAAETVSAGPVFEITESCRAQALALKTKGQPYPARLGLTIRSVAIRKIP